MAKEYLKINNLSNKEAGEMFKAICDKIIGSTENDMKEMLGIQAATEVTTKDLVSLIQESNVRCELTVFYDSDVIASAKVGTPVVKKEEDPIKDMSVSSSAAGEELPF